MQMSDNTSKTWSDSLRVNPPSFDLLVKAILSQNFNKYKEKSDQINNKLRNEPFSKLISSLEQDQPLTSLSRQILVSETLERITGTVISPDMQKFRGVLLNFEKIGLILHFFQGLGRILNNAKLSSASRDGYKILEHLYEELWGEKPTNNVIRPGSVIKGINKGDYRLINSKIHLIRKKANRIQKITENSKLLNEIVNEISFPDKNKIIKNGINGPIARAANIIHPSLQPTSREPIHSSHSFTQNVYSSDPDPMNIIRIYLYEFILALERIRYLLPKIENLSSVNTTRPLNGHFTFTMSTLLGLNHLSLEMENFRIKYVNFIPFEVGNAPGFARIIKKNEITKSQLILLFLHPEITLEQ